MTTRLLILVLSGLFLTGCYSQIRYSEAVHQNGYFWEPQPPSSEVAPDQLTNNAYREHTQAAFSNGFPLYYKNFRVAEWYARHGVGIGFFEYYGLGGSSLFFDLLYNRGPETWISINTFHFARSPRSHIYANSPLNFGPWVCWDPPYAFPGYYPSSITIFVGGGSGPLYYPGVTKGKNSRTYGRRGIGTNRVKAGRGNGGRSGILNTGRDITFTNSPSGTIRSRGTNRSGTIGTSSSNGPRIRSTGRSSSSGSSSRGRSRGN